MVPTFVLVGGIGAPGPAAGSVPIRPFGGPVPTVTLAPSQGYSGSFVNVTGGGYNVTSELNLTFGASFEIPCVPPTSNSTNATGNFSCEFQVPTVPAGTYFVNATDGTNNSSAPFTVLAPTLDLDPINGTVESLVAATGEGYGNGSAVSLTFGPYAVASCASGGLTANGTGGLNCTFHVPALTHGRYRANATSSVGNGSANFTVDLPILSPLHGSGHVGTAFDLSGSGFDPNYLVSLSFGLTSIPTASCTTGGLTTGGAGTFSCTFDVPASAAGTYEIQASDANNTGFANFTVNSALSFSVSSGSVGTQVTATATGLAATQSVSLTWNATTVLCSGTTSATGGFSCQFSVPHARNGADTVTATAGASSATHVFTVLNNFEFTPTQGPVGTSVTLIGTGYDASHAFNVTWDSTDQVCVGTTDTNGNLGCTFAVPDATHGDHNVTVNEGSFSTGEAFSVQSSLSVDPASGISGTVTTLSGFGLAATSLYDYCLSPSESACTGSPASFTSNATGSIPAGTTLPIPIAPAGTYYVIVSTGATVAAFAHFTITTAVLDLSPLSGAVGSVVTLRGSAYVASATYDYCFAASSGPCAAGAPSFVANASGDIPSGITVTVPPDPSGDYFVNVAQTGVLVATAGFEVNASLTLGPAAGTVGTDVTADGAGLPATTAYVLVWASSGTVCSGATNVSGSFSCGFVLPASVGGVGLATVTAGADRATAVFDVLTSLLLTPNYGAVESSFGVQGYGFNASVVFSVVWADSATVCNGETTLDGALTCTATVPEGPAGGYGVNASDGPLYAVATFTVVPSVSLSEASGFVGEPITATGEGFDAASGYTLTWDGSSNLCGGTTGSDGSFGCSFPVPSAVGGVHTIRAIEGAYAPSAEFQIGASLTISPTSGAAGTMVVASGTGFGASGPFTLYFGAEGEICSGQTQADGAFGCTFTVPLSPAGAISILGAEGSSQASAQFLVGPAFSSPVARGAVGTAIPVTASGLTADAAVTVEWNTVTVVCSGTANASGGFACTFSAPASPAGSQTISVVQSSVIASLSFTIVPAVGASVSTATAGAAVTLTGTGFDANAAYTASWNGSTVLCQGTTNATGGFECVTAIPAGAAVGPHGISVTEGSQTVTVPFTVAASPISPPTPAPFPWWLVFVIAIVVALVLLLFLVEERRRHQGHRRARPAPAWQDTPASPGSRPAASAAVSPRAPAAPYIPPAIPSASVPGTAAAASPETPDSGAEAPEDIDALISRLERMSQQLYKKKPSELGDVTAQLPIDEDQSH